MTRTLLPLLLAAALAAGCHDGGHFFSGKLEPAPVVPAPPQADTTPVEIFTSTATALPAPSAPAYAAGGPSGIALVRKDTLAGADDPATDDGELEDSDALVCDPANSRLVLVKARVRGGPQGGAADTFGPALPSPTALYVTTDRHALAATAPGYTVLDPFGGNAVAHPLSGGPFVAITLSEVGSVLFIASASGIQRMTVDSLFAPTLTPVPIYDNAGAATIRAIALRSNGDLVFTEGARLRRIASASTLNAVDDLATFASGEEPRGVVVNSIGDVVVAVATGATGRFDEIVPGTGRLSTLALGSAPVGVAVDGRHSAIAWTSAGGIVVSIEPAPDLTKRLLPIFSDRSCIACHFPNSGFTPTNLDLTTALAARATLVAVARDCTAPTNCAPNNHTVRVVAGSSATSFIVDKLVGCRLNDPGPSPFANASCDTRMPQDLRPVPTVEIDTISRWIDAGANP
jgi:hypothetical protein